MANRALHSLTLPFLLVLMLALGPPRVPGAGSPGQASETGRVGVGAAGSEPSTYPARGLVGLAPASVRDDFAAGLVALHDFWYGEAAARFQAVQAAAPAFTLGYWGEALALHRNPFGFTEPPLDEMRAILSRLAASPEERAALAATEHERATLQALEGLVAEAGTPAERHPAYAEAMGRLARAHPDDVETLALHVRAILLAAPTFGRSEAVRARTADAARAVLELDPDHHGGLHYLIHALDAPDTWRGAIEAADRYQRLATGASHAVHMPSHIYMQAGLWDRVVSGNRAALRTSRAWLLASGRSVEHLDHHAADFLLYGFLQQGREAEARALLATTRAHRAEFDSGTLRWYDALWSARYAAELGARSDVPLPRSGYDSVGEALGLGLHAVAEGDLAVAREFLERMRSRVADDAGVVWRVAALELEAALAGDERAVPLLRQAIALQRDMSRPNETPVLVTPPEELLGQILLELERPAEASEAFRAGDVRWPGRLSTRLGLARAAHAVGDTTGARQAYARLLEQLRQAPVEHPARAEARGYLEAHGVPVETALRILPGRAPGMLPEVVRRGSGPVPMVIIPCMSCRWSSFEPFMERNADRYTMFAVTLPGFGGTPEPELPTDTDRPVWFWNAVDAVSALLDREELRDVVLLGHSYGTVVATGVAADRPDRVRAFVNVDGNFMSDRSWFEEDPALRPGRAARTVAANLPRLSDPETWRTFNGSSRDDAARRALYHGMFTATSRTALMQYWRENTLIDLNPLLSSLRIPILDLQTVPRSAASPQQHRTDYRRQLELNGAPESVHTVFLEQTTHFVMDDRPEVLDGMVAEFLAGGRPGDFHPLAATGRLGAADLARAWVASYRDTLRENADPTTLDRLLELAHDDLRYERPAAGVLLAGTAAFRDHLAGRLGTSRSPRVDLQGLVVAGSDVVLTLAIEMEVRSGDAWRLERRRQAMVLRIVEGQVVAVSDYW